MSTIILRAEPCFNMQGTVAVTNGDWNRSIPPLRRGNLLIFCHANDRAGSEFLSGRGQLSSVGEALGKLESSHKWQSTNKVDPNKQILDRSYSSINHFYWQFLACRAPAREGIPSIVKSFPIPPYVLLPITYLLTSYYLLLGVGVKNTSIHPTVHHPLDGWMDGWMTHLWMNLGVNQNNDIL